MDCSRCSFSQPHMHYPEWLYLERVAEGCLCGMHDRFMTIEALLKAWLDGRDPSSSQLGI